MANTFKRSGDIIPALSVRENVTLSLPPRVQYIDRDSYIRNRCNISYVTPSSECKLLHQYIAPWRAVIRSNGEADRRTFSIIAQACNFVWTIGQSDCVYGTRTVCLSRIYPLAVYKTLVAECVNDFSSCIHPVRPWSHCHHVWSRYL